MKAIRSIAIVAILLGAVYAHSQNLYNISGTASGLQEVPPNMSAGTASVYGTYNDNTGDATLAISFSGLGSAVTASHIHVAPVGVNGPVIVPLTSLISAGTINGVVNIPMAHRAAFKSGGTYINIHTTGIPGGEIRAQLNVSAQIPTLGQWAIAILGLSILIVGALGAKFIMNRKLVAERLRN